MQRSSWLLLALAFVACLVLEARPARSDPGREFYAVFSSTARNLWPMRVFACNPDEVLAANVTVEAESGPVATAIVPGGLCELVLTTDQRKAESTIIDRLAFRVTSDRPVLVEQFTGEGNAGRSPSAVGLRDRTGFGTEHLVLALAGGAQSLDPSILAVVAPAPARVSVTVAADTVAGGSVPALAAGQTLTVDLPPFGVLHIAGRPDQDLTGTVIRSDVPVSVLAGCHSCLVATSPTSDDVLEAIPPLGAWGRRYVVPVSYPTTVATNLIRILSGEDGTTITTDPTQPGTPATLGRGVHLDLIATSDFVVDASKPVLVARVEGRGNRDSSDRLGDPALVLLASEERFIDAATFALPDESPQVEQWVDIVTYVGANVVVDGAVVPAGSLVPVGTSGFVHASVPLTFGRTHTVSGDRPLAVYASERFGYAGLSYLVDSGCQATTPPEVSRGSTPLWLARRGTDVLFSWEDLAMTSGSYHVYAGTIRSIWDHTSLRCGLWGAAAPGGRREAVLAVPDPGYFLVSASTCGGEGASGGDPARSDCPP